MTLDRIEEKINKRYWSNSLGLARTALALCTLLTLLFNDKRDLFLLTETGELIKEESYNLFSIFPNVTIGIWLSIIILILVIIGVYPRWTAVPHAWVSYSFLTGSHLIEGGDQAVMILTIALLPILFLDNRKNHWINDFSDRPYYVNLIAYFNYYAVILQIAVIYFHASAGKFGNSAWVDGTAVYYWVNDPTFGLSSNLLPTMNFLLKNPYIVTAMTWGTLIIELILFSRLFYVNKKYIRAVFVLGVAFHFLIIIFFGLISFFMAMFGALVLYTLWTDDFILVFKQFFIKIKRIILWSTSQRLVKD